MAEAHQPLTAVERVADPRLGVLGRADLAQLVDDLGRCAAVEWTLHRAERTGHRRRDVRAGRGDDPRRERRCVEAVVGPDDEVGVERARRALVGGRPVQLVEEARDEVEARIRVDRLEAGAQAGEGGQRGRGERGQLAGVVDGRRPGQRLGGAPGRDRGSKRVHRLGGGRQESQHVHHEGRDGARRQVVRGVPFAGPEEVGDRRIRAASDQVPDPVAPVEQSPTLPIDRAQARLPGDHALEAWGVGGSRSRSDVRHESMVAAHDHGWTSRRGAGAARAFVGDCAPRSRSLGCARSGAPRAAFAGTTPARHDSRVSRERGGAEPVRQARNARTAATKASGCV